MTKRAIALAAGGLGAWLAGALAASALQEAPGKMSDQTAKAAGTNEYAMFGAGCYWCSEAVFQGVPGVKSVVSGFAGGQTRNPTYKQVCSGLTGHAEVVRVEYDPAAVSYAALLDLFWHMHDPTTPDRQGADVGTQYRSVIFYYSEEQKKAAEASKAALEKSGAYPNPIVTQIALAAEFYPAAADHQDYYNRNGSAPYCRMVIAPKLKKLGMEKQGR
jgi:peptide-methionine (S)-S-oxide reductase